MVKEKSTAGTRSPPGPGHETRWLRAAARGRA